MRLELEGVFWIPNLKEGAYTFFYFSIITYFRWFLDSLSLDGEISVGYFFWM